MLCFDTPKGVHQKRQMLQTASCLSKIFKGFGASRTPYASIFDRFRLTRPGRQSPRASPQRRPRRHLGGWGQMRGGWSGESSAAANRINSCAKPSGFRRLVPGHPRALLASKTIRLVIFCHLNAGNSGSRMHMERKQTHLSSQFTKSP